CDSAPLLCFLILFFFSSRRRHTRFSRDWSSDVCSSDLHRLDILDIPIALITAKYLEHLERMREIDLDIAGEFLVMAATLAHLKRDRKSVRVGKECRTRRARCH